MKMIAGWEAIRAEDAQVEMESLSTGRMGTSATVRRVAAAACAVVCLLGFGMVHAASAQVSSYGDKSEGQNMTSMQMPSVLQRSRIVQHLGAQLPLNAQFVDETGKSVRLGDYFDGKHPAVLALVYFNCTMLCSQELDGLTASLASMHIRPGKDFQVIVASFDPTDTPTEAAAQKALYLSRYGHQGTAAGWHFLTGKEPAIQALTQAVGFNYVRVPGPDGKMNQFAHSSAIEIATPAGKISQYYMGVGYSPKDLLLTLVEASGYKIGSPVDQIMTYCYRYDPALQRHSLAVARAVQVGGMITMACLGSFMFISFRRDMAMAGKAAQYNWRNDVNLGRKV